MKQLDYSSNFVIRQTFENIRLRCFRAYLTAWIAGSGTRSLASIGARSLSVPAMGLDEVIRKPSKFDKRMGRFRWGTTEGKIECGNKKEDREKQHDSRWESNLDLKVYSRDGIP